MSVSGDLNSTITVVAIEIDGLVAVVTEPTNYMKLSKKITRQSRRFSKLKPV